MIGNPIGNGASSSNSGAKATSNTRSTAVGNSTTVNVAGYTGSDPSGTASDPSSTGKSEQYIGYGGGYTVRNTPEVIAPSIVGGNPCAVGASGGLSLPGFGLAAGATWADKACERRQQAALLFNMGEQKVAVELMCQDDNVRSAMRLGGKPCTTDVPLAQAPAAREGRSSGAAGSGTGFARHRSLSGAPRRRRPPRHPRRMSPRSAAGDGATAGPRTERSIDPCRNRSRNHIAASQRSRSRRRSPPIRHRPTIRALPQSPYCWCGWPRCWSCDQCDASLSGVTAVSPLRSRGTAAPAGRRLAQTSSAGCRHCQARCR